MFSERFRGLRKKSGLSQEELAEKLNVSRQAVSKWETGAAVPTADKLAEIADFFGVSLDMLMRGDNSEIPQNRREDSPKKLRKVTAVCMIAAAVLAVLILAVLQLTGKGDSIAASSAVTLNGTGIVAVLAVLCGILGIALLISSIKRR
ncbi:MAG: helix-turn-helix transcriptional regulator [Oscillospiraceae bacterium]|nr:helix-turn-helix transcriptional regulator [Oscillospiraceae bacterium]